MSFDRLARVYEPFELLILGRALQRCRTAFLSRTKNARRALICGEGDGRFIEAFLRVNPAVRVDCVDASAAMIATAKARLARGGLKHQEHVSFHHADALSWQPIDCDYDLIVTHFFLDCFEPADARKLVARIVGASVPGATWLIAEFNIPGRGLLRWRAELWVRFLYLIFGIITGITPRRLPDLKSVFTQSGLALEAERQTAGGLLVSRVWRRPEKINPRV